ncbi:MAG TPA: hypothetical protein PKZ69_06735, partial [Candidatus Cloacimonadota bacterium]|nr:hypothetical protein [Candidatus Cloacimonadota bacterium]
MKDLAKRVIGGSVEYFFMLRKYMIESAYMKLQPRLHEKALIKLREKAKRGEKVKVAFFAIFSSMWKLDGIYSFLLKDERFEPIIIVCPNQHYGREIMLNELGKAYNMFKTKGFK